MSARKPTHLKPAGHGVPIRRHGPRASISPKQRTQLPIGGSRIPLRCTAFDQVSAVRPALLARVPRSSRPPLLQKWPRDPHHRQDRWGPKFQSSEHPPFASRVLCYRRLCGRTCSLKPSPRESPSPSHRPRTRPRPQTCDQIPCCSRAPLGARSCCLVLPQVPWGPAAPRRRRYDVHFDNGAILG